MHQLSPASRSFLLPPFFSVFLFLQVSASVPTPSAFISLQSLLFSLPLSFLFSGFLPSLFLFSLFRFSWLYHNHVRHTFPFPGDPPVRCSCQLVPCFFVFFFFFTFFFFLGWFRCPSPKGIFFWEPEVGVRTACLGCLAAWLHDIALSTVELSQKKKKKAQPLLASIWLLPLRLLGWITQYYIPPNPAFLLFPVVWFLKVSYPPAAPSYRGFLKLVWIYSPESLGLSFFPFSCEGALVSLLAVGCLRVRLVFGFTFERCHFLHLSICASVIFPRHPSNTPTLRPPCSFPPPSSKSSATFLPRLLAWCSFTHPSASSTPRNSGSKLCERAVANGLWFFFRLHSVTGGGFGERRQQHLLGHNLVNGNDSTPKNGKGIVAKARGKAGAKITDKGKKSDMAGDPASKRDYRDDVRYV